MILLRRLPGLRRTLARALHALVDGRVPGRLKLIAVGAALFVISPLNFLGDIPLLGILDDAGLLGLVLMWFTRASRPYQNTFEAGSLRR